MANNTTKTKAPKITARLEDVERLTGDECAVLCMTLDWARKQGETLDRVEAEIRAWFPNWFVYRGGCHVAVHRSKVHPRAAIVMADPETCLLAA
jgi:hypothetical protein